MKNIYISILALFIGMCSVTAQVGLGTSSPNENAVLEVSSTTQGMAFPRVAAMTDIPNPATGLMVFDMVSDCLAVNVGTPAAPDWKCTGSSTLERIGIEADEANIIPSIVTVEELNGIEGVSAAVLANQADYQTYIDANPDLFSSPATVVEVNAMITAVNNEKSSTTGGTLAQVGLEGDDPDTTNSVVTAAQLAAVTGVTGVDADNETAYQDYIDDNPDLFSSPATVEEVNAMIAAVNNEADAEAGENGAVSTLVKLGTEADPPNETTPTTVTAAELAAVSGVTGVEGDNEAAYQAYINENPDLFSSPATVEEVNAMITAVNNEADAEAGENGAVSTLVKLGTEADPPNESTPTTVTAAELAAVSGVTGVDGDNEAAYQAYINENPDLFSSPATVAEVNAMIAAVNNEADAEAGENGAVSTLEKLGTEADPPNESTPTTVTAAELAAVSGVTGVEGDNEAAYQAYIDANPDLFSSPATVAEVNAMIAAVNNEADAEAGENGAVSTLVKLGTEADPPNETTPTTVTAAELAAVSGVTGVEGDNEAAYQAYINENPDLFSSPATVEEVNAMIAAVNNEADAEAGENGAVSTLVKLGTEADPPNETTPTTVTAAELAAVSGVTGVEGDNEAAYQAYIDANPDLFSSPATVEEVNAMITAVNNEADAEAGENGAVSTLEKLGTEADPPNESTPTTVTAAELAAVSGVTGVDADNEAAYQAYINENPDLFSSPATVAEVNAMIAAVNNEADAEAGENGAVSTLVKLGTEADPPNESTPTTVTAAELAAVSGVTGVDGDNEAAYQAYINENPDLFSSPATVAEVNAMIAAVNNEADAEAGENGAVSTLVKLGTEADPPNESTPTTVTAAELAAVSGVTGVEGDNEAAYQAYINNNPDLFSSPATVAEVNAMIAAVNANEETGGEDSILVQIGTEADAGTGTPSTVTAAQLAALTGITGVDPDNEADYQQYIADNPDAFSQPATLAEVQAMIDAVNAAHTLPKGWRLLMPTKTNMWSPYTIRIMTLHLRPLPAATLDPIVGDGTPDPTLDIAGVIGTDGSGDELTVSLDYNATAAVDYPAFSQTISIPSSLIEGGGGPIDLTMTYDAGTTVAGAGTITAKISAATTLNVKKLDLYGGGLSAATPGYPLAAFSLSTDSSGGAGTVGVRIMSAIPDREFGDGAHDFIYLPVDADDGKTWLNNNLGAHYSNINHASFDLTQQATGSNDRLAYGSLYQWGRSSDGHELITWTSATAGTAVNGITSTRANVPEHGNFIENESYPYDWRASQNTALWANESSTNNPCPQGYRVPTDTEYETLKSDASITNLNTAAASALAFTTPGTRLHNGTSFTNQTTIGYYWTSATNSTHSILFSFGSTWAGSSDNYRAIGYSVRCIQD